MWPIEKDEGAAKPHTASSSPVVGFNFFTYIPKTPKMAIVGTWVHGRGKVW